MLSVSAPFGTQRFSQISQKDAVFVRIQRTDLERLSAKIKEGDDQIQPQPSNHASTERVKEVTAEGDELVVWLNGNKMSRENLERKVYEEDVIINTMKGSVKQLERKVRCLQDEDKVLQKTNKELVGSYGGEETVLRKRVAKVVKSVFTHFLGQ